MYYDSNVYIPTFDLNGTSAYIIKIQAKQYCWPHLQYYVIFVEEWTNLSSVEELTPMHSLEKLTHSSSREKLTHLRR